MTDPSYRAPLPPGSGAAYNMPHTLPNPQQPQIAAPYGEAYGALGTARAGLPDPTHGAVDALAPGPQPTAPEPLPRSCVEGGWKFELNVVQQPRRARMCGFGDKDRRPITPPPCVQLIITDVATGKQVDVNEIEHGMYVLNVDLWSADGTREVNLVRHSATSPSISSTVPVSYTQVSDTPAYALAAGPPGYNPYPNPPQVNPYTQTSPTSNTPYNAPPQYGGNSAYPASANGGQPYPPPNGYQGQIPVYYGGPSIPGQPPMHSNPEYPAGSQPLPGHALGSYRTFAANDLAIHRMPVSQTQPTGMFTRNLIGSLSASAFRLTDPDDRIGIWFVLQDLSVRTEGSFRLRFSFVNVGANNNGSTTGATNGGNTGSNNAAKTPTTQSSIVNTGKAPVLASCFSDVFTVYSAKKFPGVVESTHLSKCFATQGIKIPIRKDGPSKSSNREEYDED
ncbi:velvet factor-domain-containing protein [Xylogone sp. PMI_703]|nr:velvet factor-domain-containing protein [Xylogone sp. PMI_703]